MAMQSSVAMNAYRNESRYWCWYCVHESEKFDHFHTNDVLPTASAFDSAVWSRNQIGTMKNRMSQIIPGASNAYGVKPPLRCASPATKRSAVLNLLEARVELLLHVGGQRTEDVQLALEIGGRVDEIVVREVRRGLLELCTDALHRRDVLHLGRDLCGVLRVVDVVHPLLRIGDVLARRDDHHVVGEQHPALVGHDEHEVLVVRLELHHIA